MDMNVMRAIALLAEATALLESSGACDEAAKEDRRAANEAVSSSVRAAIREVSALNGFDDLDVAATILAMRAELDVKTVYRWLSGESRPRNGSMAKFERALVAFGVDGAPIRQALAG